MLHDGLQFGVLLLRQLGLSAVCGPNGIFGMRFKRTEPLRRFVKQLTRLLSLPHRGMGLGESHGHGLGTKLRMLLADEKQQFQCHGGLPIGQTRAGCAEPDFRIVGKRPFQAGFVMSGRFTGLVIVEQALRQLHAVLRRGCERVRLARLAQRLARVQCLQGGTRHFAHAPPDPHIGPIHGKKIHHTAQHRKHEQEQ